jgi:hypothetical protein
MILRLRIIAPYSAIVVITILFRGLLFLLLVRNIIAHLTMILSQIIPIVIILTVHFIWIGFCEVKYTTLFILFLKIVIVLVVVLLVIKSSILFIVRQLLLRCELNCLDFIVLFELLVLVLTSILLLFLQEFLIIIWLLNDVICRRRTRVTVRYASRICRIQSLLFEVRWLQLDLFQVLVLFLIIHNQVLLFKLLILLSQFL